MGVVLLTAIAVSSFFAGCAGYSIEAIADKISTLPHAASPLLSNQFSGYLQVGPSKYIHYIYFESERDPATDSVVWWTNGGPGCSGLLGLFTEQGPWRASWDEVTSSPSLIRNPYSWTRTANVVFVEQPAGVGYSYSTDASALGNLNDEVAATDHLVAVRMFLERFPERKENEFYFSGESYGGHYVPQLTKKFLEVRNSGEANLPNLKGLIIGNPFTSFASGTVAGALAMWGFQVVSLPLWTSFVEASCADLQQSAIAFYQKGCFELFDKIDASGTIDGKPLLNPYAIDFPVCTKDIGGVEMEKSKDEETAQAGFLNSLGLSAQSRTMRQLAQRIRSHISSSQRLPLTPPVASESEVGQDVAPKLPETNAKGWTAMQFAPSARNSGNSRVLTDEENTSDFPMNSFGETMPTDLIRYDPCSPNYLALYLNLAEVRRALHVPSTQSLGQWSQCNDALFRNWPAQDFYADVTKLYADILLQAPDLKLLIYSGDADSVCATVGSQDWVFRVAEGAGLSIETLFAPWFVGGQKAGYITRFTDRFSFMTVHTAGHEVPAYQPARALSLFQGGVEGSVFSSDSSSSAKSERSTMDPLRPILTAFGILLGIGGLASASIWGYTKLRNGFRGGRYGSVTQYDADTPDERAEKRVNAVHNPMSAIRTRDGDRKGQDYNEEQEISFELTVVPELAEDNISEQIQPLPQDEDDKEEIVEIVL
jgi:carboxypeptidase C (cathepsin A)